jgi:hypothetical protein
MCDVVIGDVGPTKRNKTNKSKILIINYCNCLFQNITNEESKGTAAPTAAAATKQMRDHCQQPQPETKGPN